VTKRELASLRRVLRASKRLEDPNATPFLVEFCREYTPSSVESALAEMRGQGGRLESIWIDSKNLVEAEEGVQ